jgi:hypothetical protein
VRLCLCLCEVVLRCLFVCLFFVSCQELVCLDHLSFCSETEILVCRVIEYSIVLIFAHYTCGSYTVCKMTELIHCFFSSVSRRHKTTIN